MEFPGYTGKTDASNFRDTDTDTDMRAQPINGNLQLY